MLGCTNRCLFQTCLAAAIFFFANLASAKENITVDLRTRPEQRQYGVSFAAEGGDTGHSFVIWSREDDKRRMSSQEATGFYPVGTNIGALFGAERGRMFDDSREKWDVKITFIVNSDVYERARGVYQKWKDDRRYVLLFSDCTSYVGAVASAIGLSPPIRPFYPQPLDYVEAIIKEQMRKRAEEQERRANEANENAARAQRRVEAARRRRDIATTQMALALLNRAIRTADELQNEIIRYDGAIARQERSYGIYIQEADKWREKARVIRLRWS